MAEETANSSPFPVGRLVAVVLAVAVAVLAYIVLQQTRATTTGGSVDAEALPGLGIPQVVAECEARRLGEIGEALADGLMSEEAAALSRQRIRAQCRQRN